jgi:glucan phosphoethanolaminetransferase (alkaline phosphatase superfamily)
VRFGTDGNDQLMTVPTTTTPPPELQRVITLLLVNLALSAVLAVLFAAFHDTLLDYQVARLSLPASADTAAVRASLSTGLWSRAFAVIIVGAVYVFLIRRLRNGVRRAYIRVLVISVVSLVGIVYLAASGQYPSWVLVEQVVQALVLLTLLWAVTRPAVRQYFSLR